MNKTIALLLSLCTLVSACSKNGDSDMEFIEQPLKRKNIRYSSVLFQDKFDSLKAPQVTYDWFALNGSRDAIAKVGTEVLFLAENKHRIVVFEQRKAFLNEANTAVERIEEVLNKSFENFEDKELVTYTDFKEYKSLIDELKLLNEEIALNEKADTIDLTREKENNPAFKDNRPENIYATE